MSSSPTPSGRANVAGSIEEVVVRGIDLSHAGKGTGSVREAVSCSFMSMPSSTSSGSSDIFGSDVNASGRIKGKSCKGVVIRRWHWRVIREIRGFISRALEATEVWW
jgi:hypothetical protein